MDAVFIINEIAKIKKNTGSDIYVDPKSCYELKTMAYYSDNQIVLRDINVDLYKKQLGLDIKHEARHAMFSKKSTEGVDK